MDPAALHKLTYGLFVVTAKDQKDNGCISNTCIQVGSDPTRVAVSLQKENLTRQMVQDSGMFNVSVLTEDVPFAVIQHYGMQSGRDVDKFTPDSPVKRSGNGLVYLTEHTNAMFSCRVTGQLELGSHTLFVGEVTESRVLGRGESCTYAHYHKEIKPKV